MSTSEPQQGTMPVPVPAYRPTENDAWVKAAVAREMASILSRNSPDDFPEAEQEDVAEQLHEALCHSWDGYGIARELDEYHGWAVDAEMVEMLDAARSLAMEFVEDAERLWVTQCGISPAFAEGAFVSVPYRGKGRVVGEITAVHPESGRYTVFVESLGHVRQGIGTNGLLVNFEDAIPGDSAARSAT